MGGGARRLTAQLRIAYVAVIALATLADVDVLSPGSAVHSVDEALRPVVTPKAVADAARNVVLFAGWGAVWAATAPGTAAVATLAGATATGALLSVAVELAQLLSPERQPSILDVGSNTAGALLGAAGVIAAIVLLRRRCGTRSFVGVPALVFAAAYGITTALEAFASFQRLERLPGVWGSPSARFAAAWAAMQPISTASLPWFDLALFAPAGAFGVAAVVELGASYSVAALATVLTALLVFPAAELLRGFAGYSIAIGPIVLHVAAVLAGALLAASSIPALTKTMRGRSRPLALLVVYAVLLALWMLRPFHPEFDLGQVAGKLTWDRFLPLQAYRERVDLFTAVDVMLSFFLYVPAGALLAAWPVRRRGALRDVLPGVYIAAAMEATQLFIVGRWFDITDVLVNCAALLLGWVVVRRAGYAPYGQLAGGRIDPTRAQPVHGRA
jgi:VanZ family protein